LKKVVFYKKPFQNGSSHLVWSKLRIFDAIGEFYEAVFPIDETGLILKTSSLLAAKSDLFDL